MTLSAEVGTFTTKLTTGAQTVSLVDSALLPKVVFFWGCNLLSNSTSTTNTGYFSAWADDSNAQAVMEWREDDAQATMATGRRFDGSKFYQMCDALGAALTGIGQGAVTGVGTGSISLNWSTVQGDARIANYLALGGTDITAQDLNTFTTPTSTQTVSYNIGFQPDCLLVFGSAVATNPSGAVTSAAALGVYDGTTQAALGWGSLTAEADAKTQCQLVSGSFINLVMNDAALITATVAITATGYDITYSTVDSTARYFTVVALKGIRAKVVVTQSPTGTGTQNVTGAAATPAAALVFTAGNDNTNIANSVAVNIGAGAGASQQTSAGWTSTDAAATSVCDRWQSANVLKMLAQNGAAATESASWSGVTASGFDLNWTSADSTQRYFATLMFTAAASGNSHYYRQQQAAAA